MDTIKSIAEEGPSNVEHSCSNVRQFRYFFNIVIFAVRMFANVWMFGCSIFLYFFFNLCSCVRMFAEHERTFENWTELELFSNGSFFLDTLRYGGSIYHIIYCICILYMVFDDITFEDFDQPARNIIVTFLADKIFSKRNSDIWRKNLSKIVSKITNSNFIKFGFEKISRWETFCIGWYEQWLTWIKN